MNEDLAEITKIIFAEAGSLKLKIILFGSRARGDVRPGSDYDIALQSNAQINRRIIWRIKDRLDDSKIPFKVDLVDMASISKELEKRIKKEGKVLN